MKWTKGGTFTTEEFSTDETIQEVMDVVGIAKIVTQGLSIDSKDIKYIITNLEEAEYYLQYIRKKVGKALKYVPEDVQEKEHL